jgi:alkylation response protein AidB-like acyl-CoA dehydrogenase
MDFSLSEEQQNIRRTLADFAENEIKPHSTEWDKK